MKRLHRPDLFTRSCFDESRNVDFFSVTWIRAGDGWPIFHGDVGALAAIAA